MQNDTLLPLKNIRARSRRPLVDSLREIQDEYAISNDKSVRWASTLTCYRLRETPRKRLRGERFPNQHGRKMKLLDHVDVYTEPIRHKYIAVSHAWELPEGEDRSSGAYGFSSDKGETLLDTANVVLDRVTSFAEDIRKRLGEDVPFWIDKISIPQTESFEKSHAIQSMDLVYKRSYYTIGLLYIRIETASQLQILRQLLRGSFVLKLAASKFPTLKKSTTRQIAEQILALLQHITSDQWWSRAWIFQEDYVSSMQMWLLVRHSSDVQLEPDSEFGNIPGELVINCVDFRTTATQFILAYRQTLAEDDFRHSTCNNILERAGKYNILLRHGQLDSNGKIRRAMSPTVFADVLKRRVTEPLDLLAITANCCDYETRIDTEQLKGSESSLSLCMLVMYLLNGEIVKNGSLNVSEASDNVVQFLNTNTIKFDPPVPNRELTFIKHLRFSSVRLTDLGIETEGLLWKLHRTIDPTSIALPSNPRTGGTPRRSSLRHSSFYKDEPGLNEHQRNRLRQLADHLSTQKYRRLADDILDYVENYAVPSSGYEWSSHYFKDVMAKRIVRAMDTGEQLHLGCPLQAGATWHSYRGIFVRSPPEHSMDMTNAEVDGNEDEMIWDEDQACYVFTSWGRSEEYNDGTFLERNIAKYVSLEVDRLPYAERVGTAPERLEIRTWINGLCFFDSEKTDDVVFPWPDMFIE